MTGPGTLSSPSANGDDPTADLRGFLDSSPSPFHAAAEAARRLAAAGFVEADETSAWAPAARGYVRRGGALVGWQLPDGPTDATAPMRIVGAHTDSPCLRVKPRPDTGQLGWKQLAVEVYGGALVNSWLDRDLGIAGRVVRRDGTVVDLVRRDAIARVPQLAIHLDREVNERGLLLDKQLHLTPVWGSGEPRDGELADFLGVPDATSWTLCLFDLTPAAVIGGDASLLASGRLDNQVSCWAAVDALSAAPAGGDHVSVIALFDHEEVGSESTTGAAGPLLETIVERLVLARGGGREDLLRSLANSSCISADNAHAVHPNYPERHEPGHRPIVNAGPALKVNSNQRYATSAETAAMFARCCDAADVPVQTFVSRNNMPCGSTIGPITATRLGIATADVGVPQLSMHSARELCGIEDPLSLAAALRAYLAGA